MKSPEDVSQEKARAYQRQKQILTLVHLVLSPLILVLMVLSGFPKNWAAVSAAIGTHWAVSFSLFFTFFSLIFMLIDLPFSYYSGYRLEKKYGLSTQTPLTWGLDFLKQALLGFAVSLLLLLGLYTLILRLPGTWWFWAWAGFALFTYGTGKLFPVLIVPLFYRYSPVENQSLKDRIARLGARFGLSIERIHSINLSRTTRKANAAFMGIGKTKRVVLSDTLLSQFEEDEIEAVLAHELGHCCHNDIWRLFALNLAITFISFRLVWTLLPAAAETFGLQGPGDMAGLPLLLLIFSVLSLFIQPVTRGFSRRIEKQADHFALLAMGSKDAFIRCMRKLARVNLADPDPHPLYEWFFYDHPAIRRRIAYAEALQLPGS